ncbi:MAG: hydantoinase B/oxoprolinase family protein [Opitutales bacterium]|nr:hydantoinase B/oxoprolinase family protein [Opitutales bacterium]
MWQIWIDTGGTFTDCLGLSPDGESREVKILSNSALRGELSRQEGQWHLALPVALPDDFAVGWKARLLGDSTETILRGFRKISSDTYLVKGQDEEAWADGGAMEIICPEEPPVLGARILTQTPAEKPLPALHLRLATTRGTNALLERKGARTLLITNEGLEDLPLIGNQQRPDLFAFPRNREVLVAKSLGYPARLEASGTWLREATREEEDALVEACRQFAPESIAIAFLHSYRNPEGEERLAERLRREGFPFLSLSSRLSPLIHFQARMETAIVDVYLAPILQNYLDRVDRALGEGSRLEVMTSAGGLVPRALFHPKDSLLSGPAGGVVGAAEAAKRAGFEKCLSFDMGGTSTDVARWDGTFPLVQETEVAGARIQSPSLRIETVAAGGGSICSFDGHRLRVGPESAGSFPGPACYGAGGPLTLTDVQVLLGRIAPEDFGVPVRVKAAEEALEEICQALKKAGQEMSREAVLQGFLRIANETMAGAIRKISLQEGIDLAEYPLVAFGGAGGLHACSLADLLGLQTVIFPPRAGLLSADGLAAAVPTQVCQKEILEPWKTAASRLTSLVEGLRQEGEKSLQKDLGESHDLRPVEYRAALRLLGQESELEVFLNPEKVQAAAVQEAFWERFEEVFGYRAEDRPLELVRLQIRFCGAGRTTTKEVFATDQEGDVEVDQRVSLDEVSAQKAFRGPTFFQNRTCSFYLEPGWGARGGGEGTLLAVREESRSAASGPATPAGDEQEANAALRLSLFTNRFRSLTEEMGEQLRRTALSTNIRERLDFSCALLDPEGQLIVNAPHVPVHLGSLGLCVRKVCRKVKLGPGDVVVTNHPLYGGSHLPDLTVITPVYTSGKTLLGYVVNRAHHAEMGGKSPGSMPPDATCLEEEGVIFLPTLVFRGGKPQWETIEKTLRKGPWPSRAVEENLADLRAQVAANRRGERLLRALAENFGVDTVLHYGRRLRGMVAAQTVQALSALRPKNPRVEQRLDDGTRMVVRFEKVGEERWRLNFEGTAGVHPGNLNATMGIVRSAVLYSLCKLVEKDLPLNEGLLEPLHLEIPEGILAPPFSEKGPNPAVVAGNVETSQRLVDLLLLLFGQEAGSQGTMNNFVFGGEGFRLYETLGGGCGAREGEAGASGLHSHMTNTAITDPEILEKRYPVRLEVFSLRRDSGGPGRWSGGDGLVRQIRFLEPVDVSILAQHRKEKPYGRNGGADGKVGAQFHLDGEKTRHPLSGNTALSLQAGEAIRLETPGGGAWGKET